MGVVPASERKDHAVQNDFDTEKRNHSCEDACCHGTNGNPSDEGASPGYFPQIKFSFSLKGLLLIPIWVYKKIISPWMPPCCRFTPTCSAYAAEAIMTHGAIKGTAYALWRIIRCNPFTPGGYDPVPSASSTETRQN